MSSSLSRSGPVGESNLATFNFVVGTLGGGDESSGYGSL